MATFEWICKDCNIYWERQYGVGTAPRRTKCPSCRTLSNRYWQNQNVAVSFCDDKDFHTVRARYKKHAQMGFDKDSANTFLHRSIKKSKDNLNDESFRYRGTNIDYEKFADSRNLRRVGEREAKQKLKNAEELTADAYDRANKMGYKDIGSEKLDIAKPNKNKPT